MSTKKSYEYDNKKDIGKYVVQLHAGITEDLLIKRRNFTKWRRFNEHDNWQE